MSRRTRTAALLSAATLLVGGSFSLAVAPAALAAPGDPDQGQLSYSPDPPEAGGQLVVRGGGCVPNVLPQAAAAPADPAAPAAAPAALDLGTVVVTVNGPAGFSSGATVQTSSDGSWASNSGGSVITLGDDGDYTISASCQLLGVGIYNYPAATFTIEDDTPPPATANPSLVVSPSTGVAPGTTVSVAGTGFTGATGVQVALAGYATQTARVDAGGGFSGVSFTIRADQATGTLTGEVTADGGVATQSFSIGVSAPTQPGGNADGSVPGGNSGSTTTTTTPGGFDSTGADNDAGSPTYTSTSTPTLPNTGAQSLWQGVVGGLLVLSGAGLVRLGRRRDDDALAGPTTV